MAELTSTKIFGDLDVIRNLNTNTLKSRSTDEIELKTVDGTLVATLNAEGYQIISGAAATSSMGFLVQDPLLPTTDYQYLYWNNSSNYGYVCAGSTGGATSLIERFTFPLDSGSSIHVGNLLTTKAAPGACDATDFTNLF